MFVSRTENYRSQVESANVGRIASLATVAKLEEEKATANGQAADSMRVAQAARDDLSKAMAQNATDRATAESAKLESDRKLAQLEAAVASQTAGNAAQSNLLKAQGDELASLRPQVAKLTTDYNDV